MRLAVMQPYFMPYIGYFQLIAAVDLFVLYDNIKYTKKGWINRNRMLLNGQDAMFSLPLKSDGDHLDIRERELAASFERRKLLQQFAGAYRRAPHYAATMELLESIVLYPDANLYAYLRHSIEQVCAYLGLRTEIRTSSSVAIDHTLKSQDKVLALCGALQASTYLNAIGGTALYDQASFQREGIDLQFLRAKPHRYPQFGQDFVPWLSIVDVMMFNHPEALHATLHQGFDLVEGLA